uniref:C-type lectin domain-containing protein n=1 Tax=Gadus morhua TaxID=8049 RepID=A0A8C5FDU7_GADMO
LPVPTLLAWLSAKRALKQNVTEENANRDTRGSCPSFWNEFDTNCYKYIGRQLTWVKAERHCQSLDAHLVSIHRHRWIGFSDVHEEGFWMWSDGSPSDFAFWYQNEPNNHSGTEHCAINTFWAQKGWNDEQCYLTYSSVCKLRKTCP